MFRKIVTDILDGELFPYDGWEIKYYSDYESLEKDYYEKKSYLDQYESRLPYFYKCVLL